MVDREFLGRLKQDVIFHQHSASGGVVDERALIDSSKENRACRLVLDVWDNEPDINVGLLRACRRWRPHTSPVTAPVRN